MTPSDKIKVMAELLFKDLGNHKWWHPTLADNHFIYFDPETESISLVILRILNHVKKDGTKK